MINEKALQELVKHVNTPEMIAAVSAAKTHSTLIPVPNDFSIENLEEFMPYRDRFRATMKTKSIDEFSNYTNTHAKAGESECYINEDDMAATSIFDLGSVENPLHCKHKAKVELKATASYEALLTFANSRLDQREAAEWIEEYAADITAFCSEGNPIEISDVSAAIRSLTVKRESSATSNAEDFAASQSSYDRVAMETKDGLKMPAVLKFSCVPYFGLGERIFEIKHSQLNSRNEPQLIFKIQKLEAHKEDMAVEFKEVLQEKLKDEVTTYIGTLLVA